MNRLAVYCGSASPADPRYLELARDVGRELAQQLRDHGMERAQPPGVRGARRQGHVHRRAQRLRPAGVSREAGPWEQHLARLVQGDREHPGVVVEDALHAVAVVHVDIDVGDPLRAVRQQPSDRDSNVVVDAESTHPVRHRMVQTTGDVGGVVDLAGPHLAGRLDAGADDVAGRLVHPGEGRVVVAAQAARQVGEGGVGAGAHHRLDHRRVVHRDQVVLRRVRGRHAGQLLEHAQLLGQGDREVHAHGVHRMRRTEVVGRE